MTFLRTPFYRTPPGHWLCRPRLEVIRVVLTITRKSKKYYYWKQILKYKDNIKKTWEVIKVIIGKAKMISGNFPEKVIINGKNNFVKKKFANKFNNFFVKVGPKLAKKVHRSKSSFESYIGSINFKLKSRNCLQKWTKESVVLQHKSRNQCHKYHGNQALFWWISRCTKTYSLHKKKKVFH